MKKTCKKTCCNNKLLPTNYNNFMETVVVAMFYENLLEQLLHGTFRYHHSMLQKLCSVDMVVIVLK